jgi:hypothetical protein
MRNPIEMDSKAPRDQDPSTDLPNPLMAAADSGDRVRLPMAHPYEKLV